VTFDAGKLRRGELVAGGGGILLLVALFLLPWFRVGGAARRIASAAGVSTSLDGWHSLTNIRWVLLIAIAVSIALVVATATRRSPAVPVTLSMISTVAGGLASLLVVFRIFDHPGVAPAVAQSGIYIALVAVVSIAYGGYLSLRAERSAFGDPASVETVIPGRARAGVAGRTEPDAAGRAGPGSGSRTESGPAGRTGRDAERA
jgi:hypothetical protein